MNLRQKTEKQKKTRIVILCMIFYDLQTRVSNTQSLFDVPISHAGRALIPLVFGPSLGPTSSNEKETGDVGPIQIPQFYLGKV